jgi:arsenical pump membrane protein
MAALVASALILSVVMVLVLLRPRGVAIAWPALLGAVACVALRLVSLDDVVRVLGMTWNATCALAGLMLLSAVLDANGAFRIGAHRVATLAGGDGRRLFYGLCLLTAGTTALLANDGAILILTPIVAELAALLGLTRSATIAYLFATGFLCDGMSTVLPTSNLTNILLIDTLHDHPGAFATWMFLPSLAVLFVATAVLALLFRTALPPRFDAARLGPPPPFSPRSSRATWTALGLLIIGYGAAALVRVPLGVVVLVVAVALLAVEHRAGAVHARDILRRMPFSIVVFATSIFIVVAAVAQHGASDALAAAFRDETPVRGVFAVGTTVAMLACIANNLPVLLVSVLALKGLGHVDTLPYAALLGANVGSKLTPIGSLATLLWLEVLSRRGLRIRWGRYITLAAPPTILALLASLAVLALQRKVF